jgi:hypothetical protein
MNKRIRGLFAATVICLPVSAQAGGLFGDVISAIGNAAGVPAIRDLGQNLDREHAQFKNHNPDYARLEDEATRLARLPLTLSCISAFEAIVQPVKFNCGGFVSASAVEMRREKALVELATMQLVDTQIVAPQEMQGVSVRWCQGNFNGAAITPNSNEIILNKSLKSYVWSIAPTLVHEMTHIRQYRRMGTDNFKCEYALRFAACACQSASHPLEREAYDFEEESTRKLVHSGYQYGSVEMTPAGDARVYRQPIVVMMDHNAARYVFPGIDTRAHSAVVEACTTVRSMAIYDSQECAVSLEVTFSEFITQLRDSHMALTAPQRTQLRSEIGEEFEDPCASIYTDSPEDIGNVKAPKSGADACTAYAVNFVANL